MVKTFIPTPLEPPVTAHEQLKGVDDICRHVEAARAWLLEYAASDYAPQTWICINGLAEEPENTSGGLGGVFQTAMSAIGGKMNQGAAQEDEEENEEVPHEVYSLDVSNGKLTTLRNITDEGRKIAEKGETPLDKLIAMLPRSAQGTIWFRLQGKGIIAARLPDGPFFCPEQPGNIGVHLTPFQAGDLGYFPHKAEFYPAVSGMAKAEFIGEFGLDAMNAAEKLPPGKYHARVEKGRVYIMLHAQGEYRIMGTAASQGE